MAIRYNDKFNKELIRTVRNFNAKVSRLERQGIQSPVEKVSVRELKQDFSDRRELMAYMRELRKFSKRGVENIVYVDRYGNQFSKYEFNIGASRQRRALKLGGELYNEAMGENITLRGQKTPMSLMGTDYTNNLGANIDRLKSTKYTARISSAQKATLLRASKKIIGTKSYQFTLKQNFEHELESLAQVAGVERSVVDDIMRPLYKMDGQTFEKLRSAEELINKIETYYPRLKDAHSPEEREKVGRSVRPHIMALHATINIIAEEWSKDGE